MPPAWHDHRRVRLRWHESHTGAYPYVSLGPMPLTRSLP